MPLVGISQILEGHKVLSCALTSRFFLLNMTRLYQITISCCEFCVLCNSKHKYAIKQGEALSPLLLLFVSVCLCLRERPPSLIGVSRHLTGNNIPAHGRARAALIHAKEFGVQRFPSARKPNAVVHTVTLLASETQSSKSQKAPGCFFTTMLISQGCRWKTCQQQ